MIRNEYFSYPNDNLKERQRKLKVWYVALMLLVINVTMGLWLSGPIIMMFFFTCWAYEVTFALIVCIILFS